jgi:ubiquinone/menaquinone biosynthesis C-methylase UbiE
MGSAKDHYSYRVYADPETARTFDQQRFGSEVGEFIKRTQESVVFSNLPDVNGWKVVDVGAGTGRLTIAFLQHGAEVVACDYSDEMLKVLQSKISTPALQTQKADAQDLPFADQTFHCALSFRMLMHVMDWKKALTELCRVSRDWVIIDFPPRRGFLRFAPLFHRIKKPFVKNLQAYKVLSPDDVRSILKSQNFDVQSMDSGFLLPITVHRLLRSARTTGALEKVFAKTGLTQLFGSPLTIFARRNPQ